eukprot:6212518-Pleurochrysis_carterae.AAC.7
MANIQNKPGHLKVSNSNATTGFAAQTEKPRQSVHDWPVALSRHYLVPDFDALKHERVADIVA